MLTAAHIAVLLNWLSELQLMYKTLIWCYALNMATPLKITTNATVPFSTTLSGFLNRNEGSQSSPARPSGNGKHVHEDECGACVELY
jgi:hypothetical protein